MKHLTPYKIFESMFKLDTIANQFIADMSKVYNLRVGESFDKNKANCAWFTGEFYKWAKSKPHSLSQNYQRQKTQSDFYENELFYRTMGFFQRKV